MTVAKEATQKILKRVMREMLDQLKQDESGESPWIKHGMVAIRQAQRGNCHDIYDPIISVQPMSKPIGGMAFYQDMLDKRSRWEPSAIDRLAALAEPHGELAKKIAKWDKANNFEFKTFDMVADQAAPGAVPQL